VPERSSPRPQFGRGDFGHYAANYGNTGTGRSSSTLHLTDQLLGVVTWARPLVIQVGQLAGPIVRRTYSIGVDHGMARATPLLGEVIQASTIEHRLRPAPGSSVWIVERFADLPRTELTDARYVESGDLLRLRSGTTPCKLRSTGPPAYSVTRPDHPRDPYGLAESAPRWSEHGLLLTAASLIKNTIKSRHGGRSAPRKAARSSALTSCNRP